MKKTAILVMAAAIMMATSVGFASPLTDYSAGKTSIDLTYRISELNTKTQSESDSLDKKGNLDFGITTGLGNKFALQYTNSNEKSKETTMSDGSTLQASLKVQEVNVLYQLDKNLSVYTGFVSVKGSGTNSFSGSSNSSSTTKNKVQFGVIGTAQLAEKTTAYAQVGFASNFTNWKVGVSQEIAPNLELNVDYGRMQAKKMNFGSDVGDVDMTAKGLGIGVSYKF